MSSRVHSEVTGPPDAGGAGHIPYDPHMAATRLVANQMTADLAVSWKASELFETPLPRPIPHRVIEARSIADAAGIAQHPFFHEASQSPGLLQLWCSQEAVVTGPFSQFLFLIASQIQNVHLRAHFLSVIVGEHSRLQRGVAVGAHPWLLYNLCVSAGVNLARVNPLQSTLRFLEALANSISSLPFALGALGIGNERMLIAEYSAIEHCFREALPNATFRAFLRANIDEDATHSSIIEEIVSALPQADSDTHYLQGAEFGVRARLRYYDELLTAWTADGIPAGWTVADSQKLPSTLESNK